MSKFAYPAIRATMGDWTYYITAMTMRELAATVRYAHELYQPTALNEVIQRELTSAGEDIAQYLLRQRQRFFGSMILAIADGEPKFTPIRVVDPQVSYAKSEGLGLLVFDGSQRYFALDGQHRLQGVRLALEANRALGDEQVTVIFVPHRHVKHNSRGMSRTRRLFTTLNRYAKRISKKDAIVMDEDDGVAIVTRSLIEEYRLFRGRRLRRSRGKAINPRDRVVFTNIITVYDVNEIVLSARWTIDKAFKQIQPKMEDIEQMSRLSRSFWDGLCRTIEPIGSLLAKADGEPFDMALRSPRGGHLLFRPIGLTTYAAAFLTGMKQKTSTEELHGRLSRVDYDLTRSPWRGIVWHPGKGRMLAKKEHEKVATRLLSYLIGLSVDEAALQRDYSAMLSINEVREDMALPPQVA